MAINTKKVWRRKVFSVARLVHIYTSTLLFGLVVFFCVTGITLNHRWYGDTEPTAVEEILLTEKDIQKWMLNNHSDWQPDLTAIGKFLERKYAFPQAHSIDVDVELREILLDFKVPAGFATVTIIEPEKVMIIDVEKGGALGVINDLHKGRHSGRIWFWLIDISAVLMVVFSITGMFIVFQGKKNRRSGVALAIAGLTTPFFIFVLFVPNLGG